MGILDSSKFTPTQIGINNLLALLNEIDKRLSYLEGVVTYSDPVVAVYFTEYFPVETGLNSMTIYTDQDW